MYARYGPAPLILGPLDRTSLVIFDSTQIVLGNDKEQLCNKGLAMIDELVSLEIRNMSENGRNKTHFYKESKFLF